MNRDTLTELFIDARPQLERDLGRHASPREARACLRDLLDRLPQDYATAARQHGWTVDQGEIDRVRDLLDILDAALDAVLAVAPPPPPLPESAEPAYRPDGFFDRFTGRGRTRSGHHMPIPDADFGRYNTEPPAPRPTYPHVRLEVKATRYLDAAAAALEAVGRLLESSSPVSQAAGVTHNSHPAEWTDDPRLLDLIHDLLAARVTDNPTMALRRIEHLEDELRIHQGISTLRYDPADEQTEGLFEILPAPAGAPPLFVTRRPALVRGQELLRRGEVRGPSDSYADPARRTLKSAPQALGAAPPAPEAAPHAQHATDQYGLSHPKERVDD